MKIPIRIITEPTGLTNRQRMLDFALRQERFNRRVTGIKGMYPSVEQHQKLTGLKRQRIHQIYNEILNDSGLDIRPVVRKETLTDLR